MQASNFIINGSQNLTGLVGYTRERCRFSCSTDHSKAQSILKSSTFWLGVLTTKVTGESNTKLAIVCLRCFRRRMSWPSSTTFRHVMSWQWVVGHLFPWLFTSVVCYVIFALMTSPTFPHIRHHLIFLRIFPRATIVWKCMPLPDAKKLLLRAFEIKINSIRSNNCGRNGKKISQPTWRSVDLVHVGANSSVQNKWMMKIK